jgi:hypothetical protein
LYYFCTANLFRPAANMGEGNQDRLKRMASQNIVVDVLMSRF